MREIGKRIKERRLELGMSGKDVGDILGVDKTTIYRYEKGEIEKIPISNMEKMAKALHITPEYLMGWKTPDANEQDAKLSHQALEVARKYDSMSETNREKFEELLKIMQIDD